MVTSLLFPYVKSFGGKALLTAAMSYAREGIDCLIMNKPYDFKKASVNAFVGVVCLGI